MIKIELLGVPKASCRGCPIAGFPLHTPCRLLCLLVLHRGQTMPRDLLAEQLWPEENASDSRKHLRDALWRLRSTFRSYGVPDGSYLSAEQDALAFPGSRPYWLDAEDFEDVTQRYDALTGAELTATQAQDLCSGIHLYQGDLLDGIYEDWCLYEREHLRLLYLNSLDKLMVYYEIAGSFSQALALGQRALASDDMRESVYRHMMRLHWLAGDRVAARNSYEHCSEVLHDMLGIAPMAQTTALFQAIRDDSGLPTWPAPPHRQSPDQESGLQQTDMLVGALHRLKALQSALHAVDKEIVAVQRQITSLLDTHHQL